MKTTVHKNTALPAIQKITKITETKNTIPILANVALSVNGDTLTMTGTDMDIEVSVNIPCDSDANWKCTVNAASLAKAFGRAKDGIDLSLNDHILSVSFGTTKVDFSILPFENFPVLASSEYDKTFDIDALELSDMLSRTIVAASTEETRYYLNGIYWHSNEGFISSVATDGHKLAMVKSTLEQDIEGVIIPTKAVKVLTDIDGDVVTASVSQTKVRFEFGDTKIVSKVIDGTFPDYARVIPKSNPHKLTISGKGLKDAIATATIVTDNRTRGIKFSITHDNVTISARGDQGASTVDIPCTFSGGSLDMILNSPYVVAIAGQVADGDVVFELGDPMSPVRVLGTGNDGFEGVIMPMRG